MAGFGKIVYRIQNWDYYLCRKIRNVNISHIIDDLIKSIT